MNLLDRVERGAKLLDEVFPDWWERIDTDVLEMNEPCLCVLGQVYENMFYAATETKAGTAYDFGVDLLFGTPGARWSHVTIERTADHGFTLGPDPDPELQNPWSELDDLWKVQIELRRVAS